jgi:DHA1 family tetracycline resistance protein-like MFS transporter
VIANVWALHMQARFQWRPIDVGMSLALMGVVGAAVQGGLVRFTAPRLGDRRSLLVGLAYGTVGSVLLGVANRGWMIYALMVPLGLAGIAAPAAQTLVTGEVDPSRQGELQGGLASLGSVAAIVGPLIATRLFTRFAPETAIPHIPGAAFFASAVLMAVAFTLALRLFATVPARPADPASPR